MKKPCVFSDNDINTVVFVLFGSSSPPPSNISRNREGKGEKSPLKSLQKIWDGPSVFLSCSGLGIRLRALGKGSTH